MQGGGFEHHFLAIRDFPYAQDDGGWPRLNSEKRLCVAGAAPHGSQGAGVDFPSASSGAFLLSLLIFHFLVSIFKVGLSRVPFPISIFNFLVYSSNYPQPCVDILYWLRTRVRIFSPSPQLNHPRYRCAACTFGQAISTALVREDGSQPGSNSACCGRIRNVPPGI